MRIKGESVITPNSGEFTFYRKDEKGEVKQYVMKITPVLDWEKVNQYIDKPEPLETILADGKRIKNFDHPKYLEKLEKYNSLTHAWFILESLKDSDIEWATIKMNDPATWENYLIELETVLLKAEINRLMNEINSVNNPSKESAEQAFKAFIKDTLEESLNASNSQETEPDSIKSTEPVSG